MKKYLSSLLLLIFTFYVNAQDFQYLGLSEKYLTSLKTGNGIIVVGTNYYGAYWQQLSGISDSEWNKISIDSVNITAVYPHKSGPIGWAIGIGSEPDENNSEFIFCSFMGQTPIPMSYGIDDFQTTQISHIDGFEDPSICGETFAIGGRILYRRNFADTIWNPVYNLTIEGYFASLKAREDIGYIYAGGAEGFAGVLLIRSSDNGNNWDNLFPGCYVNDLDFYGETEHKIIVTDRFKIMYSSDSGINWSQIFYNDSLSIQNISYSFDGHKIYVVTNTIYYSLPKTYFFVSPDNGSTWQTIQLPIYDLVIDMDITNDDAIYLASITSGIYELRLEPVGTENIEINYPDKFQLNQNYPNPFNPSTKISWQSPVGSWQTLKIYDVLGNEVAKLVDEYKNAGSYEVEFSAKGGSASDRNASQPSKRRLFL
jgi:hypothetical protein